MLFFIQSNLSTNGKVNTHKTWGYASLAFFALLFVSGLWMLAGVMQGYSPDWDAGYLRSRTSFVWGIMHTLFFFSLFYVLAVLNRKNLHAHKRFMLMASLRMISASVTRVAFLPIIPIDGMALTLSST